MLPRRRKRLKAEIHPDEIFVDASNIPEFDQDQFEGRIERPLSQRSFAYAALLMAILFVAYVGRAGMLQIAHGSTYAQEAQNNQLAQHTLFADRGIIADRNGVPLAYNERANVNDDFASRVYADFAGLAHVVGYVKPPAKDSTGAYYRDYFQGEDGAEQAFNTELAGENGVNLTETDAKGDVVSQSVEQPPVPGKQVTLSIDAPMTQALYQQIAAIAQQSGFGGGAGVVMNVHTGELLAMTSYPEYSQNAMTNGDAQAIASYNTDPEQPFLDRATDGLYSPGSIVKPIMATAALMEGVINEDTLITSTGSISLPNPYDPAHPSVFKDWRVNGVMDVQHGIAYSSDVFFYEVGGGYQNQPGLGISKIDQYLSLFGFGKSAGLAGFTEPNGTISSPTWKAANFPDDPTWRIGDTYHTAIGQYGTQVTPLQAVREAAALANGGTLLTPQLLASSTPQGVNLNLNQHDLEVVRGGMRLGVQIGVASAVNLPFVDIAAKTGTAQVGTQNQYQNSWMIGFWPYENPQYAYAIVLEKGPAGTVIEAPSVAANFFEWLQQNEPQYLH